MVGHVFLSRQAGGRSSPQSRPLFSASSVKPPPHVFAEFLKRCQCPASGAASCYRFISFSSFIRFMLPDALLFTQDVEKVPIKLRRDCPAYFLAAPCAKDEACLEHVRRLRDPYRMMEGYLACSQVRAAKAGNSSHIPPPSEGFVEDDA